MDLNILWFILVAVLYIGYFVLEGFDFGVGILLPFLSKEDTRRRVIINTIGPHWDGNEVWLITAGGATFAAFPGWYATLFSGFYLPLFLILVALIVRGVAFEFRSKDENPLWRNFWDWAICIGSILPALLWGVAFANLVRGVPIDATANYVGGFWNLLSPYALLGGVVSLLGFTLHGAIFLMLKTEGTLHELVHRVARSLYPVTLVLLVVLFLWSFYTTDKLGLNPVPAMVVALIALLAAGWFLRQKRTGLSFTFTSLTILLTMLAVFLHFFPRVMISSLDPAWSLTIYNAASGAVTLRTMTIVAAIFVPIVLAYQAWSYWVFRQRIVEKVETLEY
ncbi:MAG: cytochrome d ubiquinol oxidase subunit II [Anaerolineae bacterium]|nr:cytochrome d ubiquinol oxidase subunit II [Anaerolineae bacterium]